MQKMIELAARKITDATRPVSFSGAGLSAESGIATFRDSSDDAALWSKFNPQELASQEGFQAAPETVTDWYNHRRIALADAKPNKAHHTLANLKDWTHITQNVDNLLEVAMQAIDADTSKVLHLHGTLVQDHCNASCGQVEKVDLSCPSPLRRCTCGAYMRPSVVWFGEALPSDILHAAHKATEEADLMLVVGTSAQVYPAAGLIDVATARGADVIVVNTEPSAVAGTGVIELVGPAGEVLPQLFAPV